MKGAYKRYTRVGPGGLKCYCCVPNGRDGKKIAKHEAKVRERRALSRQSQQELDYREDLI